VKEMPQPGPIPSVHNVFTIRCFMIHGYNEMTPAPRATTLVKPTCFRLFGRHVEKFCMEVCPIKAIYAGWDLEILECGLVHPPIEDEEHSLLTSHSDDSGTVVADDTATTVSMW